MTAANPTIPLSLAPSYSDAQNYSKLWDRKYTRGICLRKHGHGGMWRVLSDPYTELETARCDDGQNLHTPYEPGFC